MFNRIVLFLITNLAVLVLLSITMRMLGISGYLDSSGIGLDLNSLLVMAAVVGFGGSLISLAMSKWSAKFMTGAKVIQEPGTEREKWLIRLVQNQANKVRIGMPDVAIYNAKDVNAFATGMSRNNALVAVSTGLLEQMNDDEVEAVLAHEVSHVANGDMITLALIQGIINTFVFFLARIIGHMVDRAIFKNTRGHGPGFWIATIVAELILAVLASVIVMWFSRQREFRADLGGAAIAGKRKMIAALSRLQVTYEPSELPDQIRAFGISGGQSLGIKRLFMSHPPLSERIEALKALEERA